MSEEKVEMIVTAHQGELTVRLDIATGGPLCAMVKWVPILNTGKLFLAWDGPYVYANVTAPRFEHLKGIEDSPRAWGERDAKDAAILLAAAAEVAAYGPGAAMDWEQERRDREKESKDPPCLYFPSLKSGVFSKP